MPRHKEHGIPELERGEDVLVVDDEGDAEREPYRQDGRCAQPVAVARFLDAVGRGDGAGLGVGEVVVRSVVDMAVGGEHAVVRGVPRAGERSGGGDGVFLVELL